MTAPELENLTDSLQRYVGLQQAQTFFAEDITADAIARLTGIRGDISNLQGLWAEPQDWPELVDGWSEERDAPAIRALRDVLEKGLVVQWYQNGKPKSFLPLTPELITAERTSTVFRDLGRSVVEGLWARPAMGELRPRIARRVTGWGEQHPLALLLRPLCERRDCERPKGDAHLARVIEQDERLRAWVDRTVVQDWRAWLEMSPSLSADEQLETMTSLIGLHLHVALLWRLGAGLEPCYFVAVDGHGMDPACNRAAGNSFNFWRERAADALRRVAEQAVDKLAASHPRFADTFSCSDWDLPRIWCGAVILARGHETLASKRFKEKVQERLDQAAGRGAPPTQGEVRELVVDSLAYAFSGQSSVVDKVKDFLRRTGMAASIVGPREERARKRYLLGEGGLDLLVRLHDKRRPDEIDSSEEDRKSVEAFIDDIASRYGILLTTEREHIRHRIERQGEVLRPLLRHLPNENAMRHNRLLLDRRLDALRLVRRYSDASSIIQVST